MVKQKQPTQIILGPVPPALIGCGNEKVKNIITLAWVGVVNSSPPMVSVAVRPNRYSFDIIRDSKEFSINLPSVDQVELADGCGNLSGRDLNKFEHFNLSAVQGTLKYAPMIDECPISLECKVEKILELGSHTIFISRVVATYVSSEVIDEEGKIDYDRCRLLGFCAGSYLETKSLNLSIGYTKKKQS
ncbi:MAG: flavin reductase family protein [Bacillota bacterium]